jgi:hypothetical protein
VQNFVLFLFRLYRHCEVICHPPVSAIQSTFYSCLSWFHIFQLTNDESWNAKRFHCLFAQKALIKIFLSTSFRNSFLFLKVKTAVYRHTEVWATGKLTQTSKPKFSSVNVGNQHSFQFECLYDTVNSEKWQRLQNVNNRLRQNWKVDTLSFADFNPCTPRWTSVLSTNICRYCKDAKWSMNDFILIISGAFLTQIVWWVSPTQ